MPLTVMMNSSFLTEVRRDIVMEGERKEGESKEHGEKEGEEEERGQKTK